MAETVGRRAVLVPLGAPAPYVLGTVFATLCWLPVRLWEERHGSPLVALVRAGLTGLVWGVFFLAMHRLNRARTTAEAERAAAWDTTRAALRSGEPPTDEAGRAAVVDHLPAARRGALLGALLGTALLGPLAALAVHVGRTVTATAFALVVAMVLAVAARTLFQVRGLRRALAGSALPADPADRAGT
ncbi:hypothetical protein [Micromonospora chersina]|uniref:hypothetical protein n=1 Tax=Micromonospora chersina TaxID=47854 RepID=UPI0033C590DA